MKILNLTKPICKIANQIKNGNEIPGEWVEGTIVHIYKEKWGGPKTQTHTYQYAQRN